MDQLLVDRTNGILSLTLNRPERANALGPELVEHLLAEMEDLANVRLVVIRGSGKSFCAGFDLHDIDDLSDGDMLWRFVRIEQLLQVVHHASVPVLTMAHRYAYGAGADLLASSSIRVAAPETRLRMPGLNFGLVLGTTRLSRLVGIDNARDILLDTRIVDATEALELGLVNRIEPIETWPAVIDEVGRRASALAPEAMASMLRAAHVDTRADDMSSLVASATRPGLQTRIQTYVATVVEESEARKNEKGHVHEQ